MKGLLDQSIASSPARQRCFMMKAINTAGDLAVILRDLTSWVQGKIPESILEYCERHDTAEWSGIDLNGDEVAANVMSDLVTMFPIQRKGGDDGALSRAVQLCRVEILEYLASRMGPLFRIYDTTTFAAKGSLDCLKFFHRINGSCDSSTCAAAARGGHLHCLRYARENGCKWTKHVVVGAAENGHIDCWKYAHEHGLILYDFEGSEVCGRVAARGNLPGLKFAVEVCGYKLVAEVVSEAARANHADCVRYAISKGCPIAVGQEATVILCIFTYCEGTIEDQDWLRSTLMRAGKWNAKLYDQIRKLNYLEWMQEWSCPWDVSTTEAAVNSGSVENLRFMMDRGCPYRDNLLHLAAGLGIRGFDILKCLIEEQGLYMDVNGSVFDCALRFESERIAYELKRNQQRSMSYLRRNAVQINREMPCVQYLLDVGCPYTAESYRKYVALADS